MKADTNNITRYCEHCDKWVKTIRKFNCYICPNCRRILAYVGYSHEK